MVYLLAVHWRTSVIGGISIIAFPAQTEARIGKSAELRFVPKRRHVLIDGELERWDPYWRKGGIKPADSLAEWRRLLAEWRRLLAECRGLMAGIIGGMAEWLCGMFRRM